MRLALSILLIASICLGCSSQSSDILTTPAISEACSTTNYGYQIPWGYYDLEIARDGSYVEVIPRRTVDVPHWGYHINAVKLLEVSPCTSCLSIHNVHLLPNGDLSVDVSITHPFNDPAYTGFDVRGIIMFHASQYCPDDDLRTAIGWPPYDNAYPDAHTHYMFRWSSSEKGDAELMNPDGWTSAWAPDDTHHWFFTHSGYPIFEYYPGKYASGDELGTLNAFIRFHSNETRHMFEAGQTVTRTYIIRPPASGPIEASYAVYAHWDQPDVVPVTNPAVDFPYSANSPMPYEFRVVQEEIIDPDAPEDVIDSKIHWYIKTWTQTPDDWDPGRTDIFGTSISAALKPHPSGNPDDFWYGKLKLYPYYNLPNAFPGTHIWIYIIRLWDTDEMPFPTETIGEDFYVAELEFAESDGVW